MDTPHEITFPTPLVNADGRLNPHAIGWMRQPLIDTSGIKSSSRWGRNKRWEYWCILTPEHLLALTVSSLDYAGVYEVWVYERATGKSWGETAIAPLPLLRIPKSLGQGNIDLTQGRLSIGIHESRKGTRLRARIPGAEFQVFVPLPPDHERLGVVVPWSRDLFQYTVKDLGRPARGWVRCNRKSTRFSDDSWAVLDHGRGRWPREVEWNWGTANGEISGWKILFDRDYLASHPDAREYTYRLGIQFGAKWTDGSGITENSVFFDGHIYKIHDDVTLIYDLDNPLEPWHIVGGGLDLTLKPFHNKQSRTDLKYVASRTDQLFGTYSGVVMIPGVGTMMITDLIGFAEDVMQRW